VKRLTILTWVLAGFAICAAALWVFEAVAIAGYPAEARSAPKDESGPTIEELEEEFRLAQTLLDPRVADARNIQVFCLLLGGLAAAGVVAIIWWRRTLLFLLEFANGTIRLKQGRLAGEVMAEFGQCLSEAGVVSGDVWARATANRSRLGFFGAIPKNVQQRLRNIWAQTNHARVGLARR